MLSVSICGIGRVGGALALSLSDKPGIRLDKLIVKDDSDISNVGIDAVVTSWHDLTEITSDVLIIATGDNAIEGVAATAAALDAGPHVVLHTSGAMSSDILSVLADRSSIGSMHPLVSISDPVQGAALFENAYFCVDGESEARQAAEAIVAELKGHSFTVPAEKRALYHAAAVTACGHLVALIDVASEIFSHCGVDGGHAVEFLFPLIKSTLSNVQKSSLGTALTGPFARGDVSTFERHITALKGEVPKEILDIYLSLALRSVELVMRERKGNGASEQLEKAISVAQENIEC